MQAIETEGLRRFSTGRPAGDRTYLSLPALRTDPVVAIGSGSGAARFEALLRGIATCRPSSGHRYAQSHPRRINAIEAKWLRRLSS